MKSRCEAQLYLALMTQGPGRAAWIVNILKEAVEGGELTNQTANPEDAGKNHLRSTQNVPSIQGAPCIHLYSERKYGVPHRKAHTICFLVSFMEH